MLEQNLEKSGIYKITVISTGDFYIGSTYLFKKRFREHKNSLKRNEGNSGLQDAYNQYGIEKFKFEIIEYVDSVQCKSIEQDYINKLNPSLNTLKTVCFVDKDCKLSEKTKNKISESLKGHLGHKHKHTKEQREKISKGLTGKKLSKKHREAISKGRKGIIPNRDYKHTQETKNKIGDANKGKPSPMKNKKHKTKTKQLLSQINLGELNPNFGLKRSSTTKELQRQKQLLVPKIKCKYCDVVNTPQNIARWHNDNCKNKTLSLKPNFN